MAERRGGWRGSARSLLALEHNTWGQLASSPRCGAFRRDGTPCRAPACTGCDRCRWHGGKAPRVQSFGRLAPRPPLGLARLEVWRLASRPAAARYRLALLDAYQARDPVAWQVAVVAVEAFVASLPAVVEGKHGTR